MSNISFERYFLVLFDSYLISKMSKMDLSVFANKLFYCTSDISENSKGDGMFKQCISDKPEHRMGKVYTCDGQKIACMLTRRVLLYSKMYISL